MLEITLLLYYKWEAHTEREETAAKFNVFDYAKYHCVIIYFYIPNEDIGNCGKVVLK